MHLCGVPSESMSDFVNTQIQHPHLGETSASLPYILLLVYCKSLLIASY